MSTRHIDAATATVVAVVIWTLGRTRGIPPRALLAPGPFLAGAVGAVAIEIGFASRPERARRLWRRPSVRFGSPLALIGAVAVAGSERVGSPGSRSGAAAPFAVAFGGLAGYALLLLGVVSGVLPEPADWFDSDRE